MFIVKLMKYDRIHPGAPSATDAISIREANAVHVRYEADSRTVLQLGDAPGAPGTNDAMEVTIGDRPDCSYNVAYIMNLHGKTVETIR
jgi:hypothetical protein